MSYRNTSSSSNGRGSIPRPPLAPRKPPADSIPVCVHCRNLGLEFNHWLRQSPEPDSPVVCPVLLKTECRYCHELGHTVGSCPAKKRSMERQKPSYVSVVPVVPSPSTIAFTSKDSVPELSYPQSNNTMKRVDVGSLFSPVLVSVVEKRTDITYRQLPLDADGLHEHPYSASYGDPEVDRQVAERRALFTSGQSWVDICYDNEEENE